MLTNLALTVSCSHWLFVGLLTRQAPARAPAQGSSACAPEVAQAVSRVCSKFYCLFASSRFWPFLAVCVCCNGQHATLHSFQERSHTTHTPAFNMSAPQSVVWLHMKRDSANGVAICTHCHNKKTFVWSSGKSTTTMLRHLISKHPHLLQPMKHETTCAAVDIKPVLQVWSVHSRRCI